MFKLSISLLQAIVTLITSRSIAGSSGVDFARQVREQNASLNSTSSKKFRSSAAPKGTKLASGYQDRTQLRTSMEEDDKAARIKSLEDMVKLGQMEQATFEALRDEIVGGDVNDVHLVKGLDYKLLERVRKGEDVLSGVDRVRSGSQEEGQAKVDEVNVDQALETLEEKEIKPLAKEEKAKRGTMAPPSLAGKKRTRDDILRELKASRLKIEEEKKAQQPSLGPKFRKLGAKQEKSRIERDSKGREVLITVDENGKVKRKVRKPKAEEESNIANSLEMPDKDAKPLGMEVPDIKFPVPSTINDTGDIFEDAGNDYDPLGGLQEDDDSEDGSASEEAIVRVNTEKTLKASDESVSVMEDSSLRPPSIDMPPPPMPEKSSTSSRNYFGDAKSTQNEDVAKATNPLQDPTIMAALKKASTINPLGSSSENNEVEAAKLARRKQMLETRDRDAEDMDLGFGSSRFEDGEDAEDRKIKLSVWGKDTGDEEGREASKEKRKRGSKKRKGDVNSAADVLRVMERRKGEAKA